MACTHAVVVVPSCFCFTQIPRGLVYWLPVPEGHIEYEALSPVILAKSLLMAYSDIQSWVTIINL
jgi:hypothetical protein